MALPLSNKPGPVDEPLLTSAGLPLSRGTIRMQLLDTFAPALKQSRRTPTVDRSTIARRADQAAQGKWTGDSYATIALHAGLSEATARHMAAPMRTSTAQPEHSINWQGH